MTMLEGYTLEELLLSIDKEDYERVEFKEGTFEEFELLNGAVYLPKIMDDLIKETGHIPTPMEFLKRGVETGYNFFVGHERYNQETGVTRLPIKRDSGWDLHDFKWDKKLLRAVATRIMKGYNSMLVEITTPKVINKVFNNYTVLTDPRLDLVLGVDVVVITDIKEVYYFHVIKDSRYSRHNLKRKRNYSGHIINDNNNKIYFKRRYTEAHTPFTFTDSNSKQTVFINNIPVPTQQHTINTFANAKPEALEVSELKDFHYWLIENNQEGIKGLDELLKENKGVEFNWLEKFC